MTTSDTFHDGWLDAGRVDVNITLQDPEPLDRVVEAMERAEGVSHDDPSAAAAAAEPGWSTVSGGTSLAAAEQMADQIIAPMLAAMQVGMGGRTVSSNRSCVWESMLTPPSPIHAYSARRCCTARTCVGGVLGPGC